MTNSRAFGAGQGTYAPVTGRQFIVSADGTGIEFIVPNSTFTSAIAGLNYSGPLASAGGSVVLRVSQSFGSSVAGGADYGATRPARRPYLEVKNGPPDEQGNPTLKAAARPAR